MICDWSRHCDWPNTTCSSKKANKNSYFINQSSSDNWHVCGRVCMFHVTVKPQCFLYWFSGLISSQPERKGGRADTLERKHQKKKWRAGSVEAQQKQFCQTLEYDDCFIKLSYPCQVCQYVNEGAAAVGGSVGWHLAGKEPPSGTRIPLPGYVLGE